MGLKEISSCFSREKKAHYLQWKEKQIGITLYMATFMLQDNRTIFSLCWRWSLLVGFLPGQSSHSDLSSLIAMEAWNSVKLSFPILPGFYTRTLSTGGLYFLQSVVPSFQPEVKHLCWLLNQGERVGWWAVLSVQMQLFISHREDCPMAPFFSMHLFSPCYSFSSAIAIS